MDHGASKLYALRKVVVPTFVPALIGAALLAFISSWDEAVVALFQTGFDKTLPVNFYSSLKSGASPVIAAIGSMLMLLVVVLAALYVGIRAVVGRRRTQEPSSVDDSPSRKGHTK